MQEWDQFNHQDPTTEYGMLYTLDDICSYARNNRNCLVTRCFFKYQFQTSVPIRGHHVVWIRNLTNKCWNDTDSQLIMQPTGKMLYNVLRLSVRSFVRPSITVAFMRIISEGIYYNALASSFGVKGKCETSASSWPLGRHVVCKKCLPGDDRHLSDWTEFKTV